MIAAGLSIILVALFVWFLILAADKPDDHAGWFYAVSGTIITAAAFAAQNLPDVDTKFSWGFEPALWVLTATVGTVAYSFDGTNVAGTLAVADPPLVLPVKHTHLWSRQNGGAATLRWSAMSSQ